MRRLATALLFALLAHPALAQQLTAEQDEALWCGSAFFWLATNAYDTGDEIEAREYEDWSKTLMAKAVELLRADRLDDTAIGHVMEAYDETVLDELGTDKARYDILGCIALLELPPNP